MTDEPMYLISESELSELEIDSSEDTYGSTDGIEIAERIRARGPVQQATAEQIPNYHQCLHKEIRNGVEFCHFHDKEIHATLAEHDAALIAQEREKWERELRVDAQNPWCYPGCILVDKAKAQAREDVLREIDMRIEAGISALHEQGVDGSLPIVVHEKLEVLAWVRQIVEFLRHGQEREPE